MTNGRRLLLVHAHPDDESITTGATMAHYAASGAAVTLVTCTLGEEGEILPPELARLESAQADQLGGYRIGELSAAMAALGVRDHRFLGGAGRFRDSGMIGTPPNEHPRAFWRAAGDEAVFADAVAELVAVVREVRPHVVVTYDDNGDYGHPDHIMAHRVTTAAVAAAADPAHPGDEPWSVPKSYWTATPRSSLAAGFEAVRGRPELPFRAAGAEELSFGVADDVVTTTIDASAALPAKTAALEAHRTQLAVQDGFFALTNLIGRVIDGVEHFRLVLGTLGEVGPDGRERDLFAGIVP
ncbi:MAG TPA: N-acetyl-1-D-myo-inositol-2-amino-2-deoxy-alpha-D-glucopyranoside deacetylase [Jatrophihabitans sp.]|uniref:N-acetyl-1-D-myo-inositol-2-amino-2-deoxy-alpha- D-glucopyranoside deacetylase n=1 Tax=Jatrophihabitans sp. TaxID=1932789 RepID=UPI002DFC9260|nr:N-acetyl-1-D-myo-inositol-2-amino-2-deoxy-alpha-D-glucopyranoside deacetylase [Jatrophihabitans sp.]